MNKLSKFGPYLIFIAAMLWATDAPFRVHLTQELSSNFIVLAEHFVDILIALPILFLVRKELKSLSVKDWLAVIVIAVGGSALASVAFTQAFHYVNPSVAILLQKLQPLIAITLAGGILKEQLNSKFWLWAVVALAAAYIISFSGVVPRFYTGEQFNPNTIGISLALLAAFLWGASTVLGKYVLNKVSFKAMTSLRFVLAFLFLLLLNFMQHTLPHRGQVTSKDVLFIVIIAVASGIVSLFIYYRGLQDTRASVATLAELGFPMAAVIVNWVSFKLHWINVNTTLSLAQILGMVILIFAVYKLGRVNEQIKLVTN